MFSKNTTETAFVDWHLSFEREMKGTCRHGGNYSESERNSQLRNFNLLFRASREKLARIFSRKCFFVNIFHVIFPQTFWGKLIGYGADVKSKKWIIISFFLMISFFFGKSLLVKFLN